LATLFILDVLLVLVFALALAAVLRPASRTSFGLAAFILTWANLVLSAEVLSLLRAITPLAFLIIHAAGAAIALLAWHSAGRPRPAGISWPHRAAVARSIRAYPELWLLAAAVALVYALHAVLNIIVPPNGFDSLNYHLSRIGYWIQFRSLSPWPTPNLRQTAFPLNGEIGSLWSMLFLRRDVLAGFVQWFSALAAMASVFGMARLFGRSRAQSAFASLLFATLPMILLQSTSTQNDLIVAALFMAMVYFFLEGLRWNRSRMMILSGLALGLAVGVKTTAVMALPGFIAGAAVILLFRRPIPIALALRWAGACLAGFLLLGAFNYFQNWVHYGHPLGPQDFIRAQSSVLSGVPGKSFRAKLASDLYSLADPTGLPGPIAQAWMKPRNRGGAFLFKALGVPLDSPHLRYAEHRFELAESPPPRIREGTAFFGPLGLLVWMPAMLFWLIAGIVKRDDRFLLAVTSLGFVPAMAVIAIWSPFRGRYFCLAIACAAPLVSGLIRRGRIFAAVRRLVVALACLVMAVTVARNAEKPLIGEMSIWGKSRIELRMTPLALVLGRSTPMLPELATVGTVLGSEDLDYPLFGERLTRRIIPLFPRPEVIDGEWLRKVPYRYIIAHWKLGDIPFVDYSLRRVWDLTIITRRRP